MNPKHSALKKIEAQWIAAGNIMSAYAPAPVPKAVYDECRSWGLKWCEEVDRLISPEAKALCEERGPLWDPMIDESLTDLSQTSLFEQIELQVGLENLAQSYVNSGLQEIIDGSKETIDKIVLDRLCFLQSQIDAKRDTDPSLSEQRVHATLQRMRQLKRMLQEAKLPPDAEMRGPLFDNFHAGKSLSYIMSLQIFRERNEKGEFKPILKSGLQEISDGSKEQPDEIVLDRLCFLREFFVARWDKGWNEDPLSQQKRDALIGGSEKQHLHREQEQRTRQKVQTILQHMRQQRAAGQAPVEFSMGLPCVTTEQARWFFTDDVSHQQIDAKQNETTEGNVVPFPPNAVAGTERAVVVGKPQFRDLNDRDKPRASLANAVIAINALGIEVRHDLFHHRIIVKHNGDITAIQDGPLNDDTIGAIRSLINNTYGIDCGFDHTLAAAKEIARENAFDPVRDMLNECQGKWDGVKRLDTWVIKYLGCPNSKLNRAIGRATLVAACRRARVPGCKFDTITVLEGVEGTNKSTAIRVLAGDENFSDQSIIGATDKEVQEQLDGVWMHENADLAGMRRAEVEHVKAFASRQVDRARPAYGRFREDRQRRSIEWGTTNNDQYLLSQTGNRRFWPLKTGAIDLEALKRDRDQLLGEAATYEAAGESITLDPALWGDARDAQEQRRVADAWEDLLDPMPETVEAKEDRYSTRTVTIVHKSGDGYERVASADVLTYVLEVPKAQQTSAHGQRLARAMEHQGWERNPGGRVTINGAAVRGYIRKEHKAATVKQAPCDVASGQHKAAAVRQKKPRSPPLSGNKPSC